MSSMLVRHPREDETAGLNGRRFRVVMLFLSPSGAEDCSSPDGNEWFIESESTVGVVVSGR
jgi:hypothetical protein